jgi:hypothetical protein
VIERTDTHWSYDQRMSQPDAGLDLGDEDALLFPDDRRRMVTLIFRLPVRVPVPHLHFWVLEMGGELDASWDEEVFHVAVPGEGYVKNMRVPFVQLRAWQVKRATRPPHFDGVFTVANDLFPGLVAGGSEGSEGPPDLGHENYETVIEAVTQGARSGDDDSSRPIVTVCFDRALTAMNEVIEALAGATGDRDLAPVPRERLSPFALVASRPVDETAFDLGPALYLLSWNVDAPRAPLDEETLSRATVFLSAARQGQPFLTYLRLARRASAALNAGDYIGAVLMAAASGEVLLNTVLRGLMIEEGDLADIAGLFNDPRAGFVSRLRSQYASRLGGRWDHEEPGTALGHWEQSARRIRHRVIHTGYPPTMDEAVEALHGAELLEAFVKDRLVAKRRTYPKTALSLLGLPGMRKRGMLNARIAGVIAQVEPEMAAFWADIASA